MGTLAILLMAAGVVLLIRGTGAMFVETAPEGDPRYIGGELPIEFTVCTYNIQGRPVLDDTKGKFPEIGRRMEPFDLIGFQECFLNHDVLWSTMDHPVQVYHGTLRSPWKLVGSGLGNSARFPLIGVEHMHYTSKGEFQNQPASKGLLMTRHDIGGHTVDFYNTHMEAGRSDEAMEARRVQVAEIIDFVNAHSPPGHTVIFVGDFNMTPLRQHDLEAAREAGYDPPEAGISYRQLGFQRMMEGLGEDFQDAMDELFGIPEPYSEENHDMPWWRRPGREHIDRVLFRAGEGLRLVPLEWHRHIEDFRADDGELLSDHDPISVRFRLETAP